jgi:hypothetical protein
MRFVNVLAILAMTGLGLTLFQNCSKSKFADSNAGLLEQSSLSASTIFINDDALYTNNTSVRVQVNLEKPMWMYVTNDPSCATGGVWQNFAPEIPWVLGSKNKETSVYIKFKTDYTESGCSFDSIVHDDIIPTLSQLGSVAAITNSGGVNISLNAADVGSGVDKILCPSDVASCGNAVMVSNAAEGQRNVTFYAMDKAGNKSNPLTVSWLYDKTPPTFTVPDKPGLTSKDLISGFRIVASDNFTPVAEIKFKHSLDGAAYVDVGASFNVTVGEGAHTINIVATDKAGNQSAPYSYSWTVGTKLPSVIFTKTPKDYDNTKGSFEFKGEDQFKVPLTKFECSLNGAAFAACTSPVDLASANLNYGSNTFSVRGIDSLMMVGEKSHTWKYDNKKPVLTFVPAKTPAAFSKNVTEEVAVTATEDNLESIEFVIDGASKQKALLTNYLMSNLTEIKHTIQVVAVDKAGNISDPINHSFWSDFTKPVVTLPALAGYSNSKNQTINVSATDNNTDALNVLKYYNDLDSSNLYAQFTPPLLLTNLPNGPHQVSVYAVDMAGNKSDVIPSTSIYIDLLAPTISIIKKPADNMATGTHSIINFTVTDVGSGIQADSLICYLTKGSVKAVHPCAAGADIDILNDEAANYQFDISVKDKLGQEATAKINWLAAQMYITKNTPFNVSQIVNSDVDILFLVGNDQAMGPVLTKIGNAFNGFMQKIQGLNWRLAITTADFSGENEGSSGNILMFGNSQYYLTPSTANAETLFKNRLNVGTNQSAQANKDKALTAMNEFFNKALSTTATKEKAFLRPDAVLVTIIVDHRDEITNGNTLFTTSDIFLNGNDSAVTPVAGLYDRLGANKAYLNHSSVVLDQNCANQSPSSYIGTTYMNLARDTGGINADICSDNYATQMNNFGNAILTKVSQIQLDCTPVDEAGDGQIDIDITLTVNGSTTPVLRSDYTVTNNVVRFVNAPSTVGDYNVTYRCLSWQK